MFRYMKRLLSIAIGFLAIMGSIKAQDTVKRPLSKPATEKLDSVKRAGLKEDSAKPARRKSQVYREAFRHVRRKFDSTLFTTRDIPTNSDFAEDLERVYQILNRVPTVTESFVQLSDIDNQLDGED